MSVVSMESSNIFLFHLLPPSPSSLFTTHHDFQLPYFPLSLRNIKKGLVLCGKAPPRSLAEERKKGVVDDHVDGALIQDGDDDVEADAVAARDVVVARPQRQQVSSDSISLGIKEPVYEVIEVTEDGMMSTKKINRRQLLKSSGLRLRDIRSVDPSLWLTNSAPTLLVRDQAILLNFGSLRAIVMHERVLVFDYNRRGGKAFLRTLLPRLNPKNINGGPSMPFELEVVEAALLSRIQRYEQRLMDLEPRVSMENTEYFLFYDRHYP